MTNHPDGPARDSSPWRSASFRWYFAGTGTSWLGSAMAPVALAFAVLSSFHTASALGLTLAARSIPLVVFLIAGGTMADRMPRSRLLVVANLGSTLTQGAVAALLLCGTATLGTVIGLEAANGALAAFTQPAMAGIVPELVEPSGQQRANSLLGAARSIALIAGRPLAGILVAAVGGGWAIALDAATYLVAALSASRLKLSGTTAPASQGCLLSDIRSGWTAYRGTTWIWVGSVTVSLVNCVQAGIWTVLGPVAADHTIGPAAWGLVLSMGAAGLVVMSAVMYRIKPKYLLRFGHLCLPYGAIPLIALALTDNVTALAVAAFLGGASTAALNISWNTSLQTHTPTHLLSRVAAFDSLGALMAVPLGQTAISPLAAAAGTTRVELLGGLLFACTALLPLAIPEVRNLGSVMAPGDTDTASDPHLAAR